MTPAACLVLAFTGSSLCNFDDHRTHPTRTSCSRFFVCSARGWWRAAAAPLASTWFLHAAAFNFHTSICSDAAACRHLEQLALHPLIPPSFLPPPPTCIRSRCPKEQPPLRTILRHFAHVQVPTHHRTENERQSEWGGRHQEAAGAGGGGEWACIVATWRRPFIRSPMEPLTLLAVALVKSHLDTLVLLQLCNSPGISLFSFVRLPLRVHRPLKASPALQCTACR